MNIAKNSNAIRNRYCAHQHNCSTHLECRTVHEARELLVAYRAWLLLLARAQWACSAVGGCLSFVLGLKTSFAELVPAWCAHWHCEHELAHATVALG